MAIHTSLSHVNSRSEKIAHLRSLYASTTKHSHYQIMPDRLSEFLDPAEHNKKHSRYDRERMDYFKRHVPFAGASVVDIGSNTGYFSFEALSAGARNVLAFEGNPEHADFIRTAADLAGVQLQVREEYLQFHGDMPGGTCDIVLLLNVLHHVGSDFGDKQISMAEAKELIIKNLNYFADQTKYVIFQIGFSWMTNYDLPLFPNGSKAEMIEMVTKGVKDHWDVVAIGIAEVAPDGTTRYVEANEGNLPRNNAIGEFRNRPIFILKSRAN